MQNIAIGVRNPIMKWVNGINETTVRDNIDENYEMTIGETHVENSNNLNGIINSFNMVIKWAKENDLPNNEIFALQNTREKAIIKNILIVS